MTCSWCGTLRGSLMISKRPLIGGGGESRFVICDLCVADLVTQCRLNFGSAWPELPGWFDQIARDPDEPPDGSNSMRY